MENFITLSKAEKLANQLIEKYYVNDIGNQLHGWTFAWNGRKSAYGVCNFRKKQIQLSNVLTQFCTHEQVENTILHEIAHAIAGHEHGHDYTWQRIAQKIGCDAQRCNSHTHNNGVRQHVAKLVATCPKCGHKSYMNRKPKLQRSCGKCAPYFTTVYLLVYKLNPEYLNVKK